MAMDEVERAMLDPRVNPACSSRIFLHMMPELNAEPKDVVAEWKKVLEFQRICSGWGGECLFSRIHFLKIKYLW